MLFEFIYVFDLPKVTYLKIPFLWQVNWCRYCQQCRRLNWLVADWLASRHKWRESTCRPGRRKKLPGSTRQRQVGRVAIWMGKNHLWIKLYMWAVAGCNRRVINDVMKATLWQQIAENVEKLIFSLPFFGSWFVTSFKIHFECWSIFQVALD
jgi:hypothetical protein